MRISKIVQILYLPYPFYDNKKQGIIISFVLGGFISYFCLVFKPFPVKNASDLVLIGYGPVVFLVSLLYTVVLPSVLGERLKIEQWKVYNEILWIASIILTLSLVIYFYTAYAVYDTFNFYFKEFVRTILVTFTVAVIPTILILSYKMLYGYRKIIKGIKELDAKIVARASSFFIEERDKKITIYSSNNKERVEILIYDFLYIASFRNYVEIFYEKSGAIHKKVIRNNIHKVEKQVSNNKFVIRCHRSYIVNLMAVKSVSGNSLGYKLFFKETKKFVPVSRSYIKSVKKKFL